MEAKLSPLFTPPAPGEYSLAFPPYQCIVSVAPALRRTQVVTSDIQNNFYLATIGRRLKSAPLCEVEHCCRGFTVERRRNWIHTVLSSFHYSKRILMKRKTAGKPLPCRFHGVAQNGLTWHSVLEAFIGFSLRKDVTAVAMSGNWVAHGKYMYSRRRIWRQKCIVWALMPQMHKTSFTFLILSAVYFSFTPFAVQIEVWHRLFCPASFPSWILPVCEGQTFVSSASRAKSAPACAWTKKTHVCGKDPRLFDKHMKADPCTRCDLAFSDK